MRAQKHSPAGPPASAKSRSGSARSNRILLVEDDVNIRLLSADLLYRSGYQVDTAGDGESGWEALQSRNYNLLITDHQMPKVTGLELVKMLRTAKMAVPVILASGAMPEELNRLPWLQLAATLLKPFTADELLGTVKRVLCETDSAPRQVEPLPIRQSQPSAEDLRL